MKYLIELVKKWNHTMKYEVFDNAIEFTFRFGGGFQAIMTSKDVTKDNNWELELYNSTSKHRDKVATDESLDMMKFLVKLYAEGIKVAIPSVLDNINLN